MQSFFRGESEVGSDLSSWNYSQRYFDLGSSLYRSFLVGKRDQFLTVGCDMFFGQALLLLLLVFVVDDLDWWAPSWFSRALHERRSSAEQDPLMRHSMLSEA